MTRGDHTDIGVDLRKLVGNEKGMSFAIRAGGK